MSEILATGFGFGPPKVFYKIFELTERQSLNGATKDRLSRCALSIHRYSQTLGHGRGLEDSSAALPHLRQPAEIYLRGYLASGFSFSVIVKHFSNRE